MRKQKKTKEKHDRLLRVADSGTEEMGDYANGMNWPKEMIITGDLGIGTKGNPVTIYVEDEVTGETLEVNNVSSAFLVIQDTRKATSGWLSLAVGSIVKLADVLGFMSKMTLEGLKKLTRD